jgi:hypothetical protein
LLVLACFSGNRKSQKQKQRRRTDNSNWFHDDSPLPRIARASSCVSDTKHLVDR